MSAVLTLSSAVEREPIAIDGVEYPLAVPRDLTFTQSRDFVRWWTRIGELEAKVCAKCPTSGKGVAEPCTHRVVLKREIKEYEDLNLALARLALPDAGAALAGLGAGEHQAVTMRFFDGAIRRDPAKWAPILALALFVAQKIQTGPDSSPRFNATTREPSRSSG